MKKEFNACLENCLVWLKGDEGYQLENVDKLANILITSNTFEVFTIGKQIKKEIEIGKLNNISEFKTARNIDELVYQLLTLEVKINTSLENLI